MKTLLKQMLENVQENENIPLKFDIILFQVMVLRWKFISDTYISEFHMLVKYMMVKPRWKFKFFWAEVWIQFYFESYF